MLGFCHGIHQIHTGLVESKNVGRRQDAHVGRNHRFGIHPLAIARNRHVAHHVDIRDMLAKMVDNGLCRFRHSLHEFLLGDIPLVVLSGRGMNPCLADPAVGTADADILIAASETALRMSFEMCQHDKRIVIGKMAPDGHFLKPFAAYDGKRQSVFFIHDVHRTESPSVHLQRLPVLLRRIAIANIICVCFHNAGIGQILADKRFHPFVRNDVRSVLLSRVQFHSDTAFDIGAHLLVSLYQAFGAEIARKVDNRFVAGALFVRHILISVFSGHGFRRLRCCCRLSHANQTCKHHDNFAFHLFLLQK